MRVRRWVIGAVVTVALTACGSDTTDGNADVGVPTSKTTPTTSPTSPTSPTSTAPTRDVVRPASVSVVRGGGIRPTRVSLHFAEGEPPPAGYTAADAAAVLAAADDPALRATTQPTVGPTCCDQYVYVVTIDWSDGLTTRFDAVQGAIQPPALAQVISLAESPS